MQQKLWLKTKPTCRYMNVMKCMSTSAKCVVFFLYIINSHSFCYGGGGNGDGFRSKQQIVHHSGYVPTPGPPFPPPPLLCMLCRRRFVEFEFCE